MFLLLSLASFLANDSYNPEPGMCAAFAEVSPLNS